MLPSATKSMKIAFDDINRSFALRRVPQPTADRGRCSLVTSEETRPQTMALPFRIPFFEKNPEALASSAARALVDGTCERSSGTRALRAEAYDNFPDLASVGHTHIGSAMGSIDLCSPARPFGSPSGLSSSRRFTAHFRWSNMLGERVQRLHHNAHSWLAAGDNLAPVARLATARDLVAQK
jgi:hypothetical protein